MDGRTPNLKTPRGFFIKNKRPPQREGGVRPLSKRTSLSQRNKRGFKIGKRSPCLKTGEDTRKARLPKIEAPFQKKLRPHSG